MRYERRLKLTKTGAYEMNITKWTSGDLVTSFSVISDTKTTVDSQTESNGFITFSVTGVELGWSEIHFEFATATTSDCTTAQIYVIEDC